MLKSIKNKLQQLKADLETKREMKYQLDPDDEYFEDEDPNDWDEDLYDKYYNDEDEEDPYEEVYKLIKPEFINKENK